MSASTQGAVRGARGRHALKDVPGTWETRRGVMRYGRESEGFIVVMKRGNARGAKGPQRNVYLSMREAPLECELFYGNPANAGDSLLSATETGPIGQVGSQFLHRWCRGAPAGDCLAARVTWRAVCGKTARTVRGGENETHVLASS